MPMYEYTCKECNEEFEELVSLSEKENPPCPRCNSKNTEKKMSLFGGIDDSGSGSSCTPSGFS